MNNAPRYDRLADDEDELDGCEEDFAIDPTNDEEAEYLPLFPEGRETPDLAQRAQEWREILGGEAP